MAELESPVGTPPKRYGGDAANSTNDKNNKKQSIWKRPSTVIVGTVILAAVFIWGLGLVANSFSHESTDDAFLAANIV